MISKVGIVVPTLGRRPDFLTQALDSIKHAGDAYVVLVAPEDFDTSTLMSQNLIQKFVKDPGTGLSQAINFGITCLPSEVEFVNWLGDDDLLHPASLEVAGKVLKEDPKTVMVFGSCDYIDEHGNKVWENKSGQWAVPLLRFGPDLIPQPGALFRRAAFEKVGGLSTKLDWAFDFDLFIKLAKLGKLKYLHSTLASFRWHPDSLSVGLRKNSVIEASRVRVSHLPTLLRPLSWLWEYPVRQATLVAGERVSRRVAGKNSESKGVS